MSCSADDVKHVFVVLVLVWLGMHLIVLALATLLPMPRSASPVAVSLPSPDGFEEMLFHLWKLFDGC